MEYQLTVILTPPHVLSCAKGPNMKGRDPKAIHKRQNKKKKEKQNQPLLSLLEVLQEEQEQLPDTCRGPMSEPTMFPGCRSKFVSPCEPKLVDSVNFFWCPSPLRLLHSSILFFCRLPITPT